jgi:hypothetical protein
LNAQFVNIDGGTLIGEGEIFVGTGPINGVVRNISGRVEPSNSGIAVAPIGSFDITGDFANLVDGTLAIDLHDRVPTEYDRLEVSRFAFLGGTLEVMIRGIDAFTPAVGDMFNIITAGEGIVGEFDNLILPTGFRWDVDYGANSVVLKVVGLGLAGDFNGDGAVNSADYIVWRKTGGSSQEYEAWRTNFGRTNAGGGSTTSTGSVPEPATLSILFFAALGAACGFVRRRRPFTRTAQCAELTCNGWSSRS